MPTRNVVSHGDALMLAALVVGLGAEAGPTPYRLVYARRGASGHAVGHAVGRMQTDFGREALLAPGYVDAVLADAAKRGVVFTPAERAEVLRRIVTHNPRWEDVPAAFKQAANAFGDKPAGQQWIHDHLDARCLRIAARAVEAFDAALAGQGIALDPKTRTETLAMVAKIAHEAGVARSTQLVEAVETGKFTGLVGATQDKLLDYPLPKDVSAQPLASAWIAGFAKALERDGVSSALADAVGDARRFGRNLQRIASTPGARDALADARVRYDLIAVRPDTYRDHGDLAAIRKWITTGTITAAEITVARSARSAAPVLARGRHVVAPVASERGGEALVRSHGLSASLPVSSRALAAAR
jgi:hypothetical protein